MSNQANYVSPRLTGVSTAWQNSDTDFISDYIFPEVLVKKPTFEVAKYGKDALIIPSSNVRAGEAKAKRVTLTRGVDTYGPLNEHALSDVVTREDYQLTDDPFEPEADAVENIHQKMALVDENDLATQLSDTGIITQNTTLSGTSQWNDSNSNPFQNLKTAAATATFKKYNTLFMGSDVWDNLMLHPELLDRIKWSQTGVLTKEAVLALFAPFGITQIYVGRAQKNTGKEGTGTNSLHKCLGQERMARLRDTTTRPQRDQRWLQVQLEDSRAVTREEKNNPPLTEIVVRDQYDHIIMNTECFYLIKDAVA